MDERPLVGDRFRLTRDADTHVSYRMYAPSHTVGGRATVPRDTVIFALSVSDRPTAKGFIAVPEDWDRLEPALVPEAMRENRMHAGGYYLHFDFDHIGDLLEPLEPMKPRPAPNWSPWEGRRDHRSTEDELLTSYYCWSRGDKAPLGPRPERDLGPLGRWIRVQSIERHGDRYLATLTISDSAEDVRRRVGRDAFELLTIKDGEEVRGISSFADALAAREALLGD
jgi:hypothetical protein